MKMKHIIAIVLCCFATKLNAQNPVYRTINTNNGLPSNTTYSIYQDNVGFVWIAHDKGLSRFDGKQFVNYAANGQQGKSLSNLFEAKNQIWCQDFSGNLYHTQNGKLVIESRIKSKGAYTPASCLNNDIITVINYDSIRSLNLKTGIYKSFAIEIPIQTAYHTKQKKIIFLSNNNLLSFDGGAIKNELEFDNVIANIFYLISNKEDYYAISKDTYPSVYKISGKNVTALPVLKKGLFIQGVNQTDNEIWICTSKGSYCFDNNFNPKYDGHCFFEDKSISNVLKDKEGNYWFCSLNDGVLFVPDINVKIYTFPNTTITCLGSANNQEEIIIGTSNNTLLSFNIATHQSKYIYKEEANHEVLDIEYDSLNNNILFCSNKIYYIHQGKKIKEIISSGKKINVLDKQLFVCAYGSGISLLPRTGNVAPIPNWLKLPNMEWEAGVYKIETKTERGRDVLFDNQTQKLFTATAGGVFYYSPNGNGIIKYHDSTIYASRFVQIGSSIIAGTYTQGLFKIDGEKVTSLNLRNNKLCKTVYHLKSYENWIWIEGDGILQCYNILTNELVQYDNSDGLKTSEIKDFLIKNGDVFIATTEGLVKFNNSRILKNLIPPKLILNSINVNNKAANYTDNLKLKHTENNLKIFFSTLSYRGGESVKVQYRINANNWQTLDSKSNLISLPSLSPDNYIIEIRAFNEDGVVSTKNIILKFTIENPFYKTPWFIALLALVVFGLIYAYFKNKLINERKNNKLREDKNKLEQELKQSMLSSIKSQMNPHFLFNALNTIQSYIYTNDKENASQYLGKFSELTRMILEMSNKEIVSLAEEIKSLKLYVELEQLRFEDKLVYEFVIDENLSLDMSFIPSMLIQPYVENAIKHGLLHQKSPWRLTVTFTEKDNGVDVIVDDNGVGRKRSAELNRQKNKKQHESFATSANQKRLEILNKDVNNAISIKIIDKEDNFGNEIGTCVQLHIPFALKN